MADESEQKTLQDLFRVINDMRGDIGDLRGEMNTRFERVDARFDAQDAKIDAVRDELKADIQASTTKLTEGSRRHSQGTAGTCIS